MFKHPATILFLFLVVAQTFSKGFLIAGFTVNRDYITRKLCVNRLDPISCCKGSCFLKKSLQDDEDKQSLPGKSGQQQEVVLQVHRPENVLPEPLVAIMVLRHATRYIGIDPQEYLPSFFAPPRLG
jgi:hypothetical protein